MRLLLLILAFAPLSAWANYSRIVFSVPNYGGTGAEMTYRLQLDDFDSRKDELQALSASGLWDVVYVGPITSVEGPRDTIVHSMGGNRAGLNKVVRQGDFSLEKLFSPGLRIESAQDLVLLTYDGAAIFKDVGPISEVVVLDGGESIMTEYQIISIKGIKAGATYMLVEDMVKNPVQLAPRFIHHGLTARIDDDGNIHVDQLGKVVEPAKMRKEIEDIENGLIKAYHAKEREANPLPASLSASKRSADQVLNQMLEQLDTREFAEIGDQLKEKVEQTVRAFVLREFPELRSLQPRDPAIKMNVDRLANALAILWVNGKLNGTKIKNVLYKRLEARQEKRVQCELALMKIKGPNGYHQGTALRALNALYRKMWKSR